MEQPKSRRLAEESKVSDPFEDRLIFCQAYGIPVSVFDYQSPRFPNPKEMSYARKILAEREEAKRQGKDSR